jgi:predicted amidophosphoribosyltransferase
MSSKPAVETGALRSIRRWTRTYPSEEALRRDAWGRFVKVCWGCWTNLSDGPSGLCPGCQAYRDHQH